MYNRGLIGPRNQGEGENYYLLEIKKQDNNKNSNSDLYLNAHLDNS